MKVANAKTVILGSLLCCMAPSVFSQGYYWRNDLSGSGQFSSSGAACVASLTQKGLDYSHNEPVPGYAMVSCHGFQPNRTDGATSAYGGAIFHGGAGGGCGSQIAQAGTCTPNKNSGPPAACGPTNPINLLTGYKYQSEVDLQDSAAMRLSIQRVYHWDISQGVWRFNSQPSIVYLDHEDRKAVEVNRNNHKAYIFEGHPDTGWTSDADVYVALTSITDSTSGAVVQWQLRLQDDSVELYSAEGTLQSITYRNGNQKTYINNLPINEGGDGRDTTLDRVEDWLGNSLSYTYDNSARVIQITASNGAVYRYAYNSDGMLEYVAYPDDTPNVSGTNPFGEDNPFKQYHYESTDFPQALTGVTDEKSVRYATWTYDTQGRATSSEHANSADKVTIDYSHIDAVEDRRVRVTNKLGKDTTYHFDDFLGVNKVTQVEGHASQHCAAANKDYSYYADTGLLKTRTDWQGRVTRFEYNGRGLETKRVEAENTSEERVFTTKWHGSFNVKTEESSSVRVQKYEYDATGNLLTVVNQINTLQ